MAVSLDSRDRDVIATTATGFDSERLELQKLPNFPFVAVFCRKINQKIEKISTWLGSNEGGAIPFIPFTPPFGAVVDIWIGYDTWFPPLLKSFFTIFIANDIFSKRKFLIYWKSIT